MPNNLARIFQGDGYGNSSASHCVPNAQVSAISLPGDESAGGEFLPPVRFASHPVDAVAATNQCPRRRPDGFFTRLDMSSFTPTQSTLEPQGRPDNLSAAVLHSLSRPIRGKTAWGPVRSFILGGLTFGILPLIAWPKRFARFVVAEQQQLWHLVEWLRIQTGDEAASQLRDAVRDAGALPTLWVVPIISLAVIAINFFPWLTSPGFQWRHLIGVTYIVQPWEEHAFWHGRWIVPSIGTLYLRKIWIVSLSAAYLSHWLHVHQHVRNVNRFLRQLNIILVRQHLPPVALAGVGIGLRPLWIIAGLIGLAHGAVWAIPAALAGAVHQRYVKGATNRIRGELAQRVNILLQQQRPPINVPTPHGFRVTCRNDKCAKVLPAGATFCPRCGTRMPNDAAA